MPLHTSLVFQTSEFYHDIFFINVIMKKTVIKLAEENGPNNPQPSLRRTEVKKNSTKSYKTMNLWKR